MLSMKTISIFILLIYWSVMIFGPVISKNYKILDKDEFKMSKIGVKTKI